MKPAGYIKFKENSTVVVTLSTLQEYMVRRITRYHAGRAEAKDIYPYQKSSVNLFVVDLRGPHQLLVEVEVVALELSSS